jgi:hypothetical protein
MGALVDLVKWADFATRRPRGRISTDEVPRAGGRERRPTRFIRHEKADIASRLTRLLRYGRGHPSAAFFVDAASAAPITPLRFDTRPRRPQLGLFSARPRRTCFDITPFRTLIYCHFIPSANWVCFAHSASAIRLRRAELGSFRAFALRPGQIGFVLRIRPPACARSRRLSIRNPQSSICNPGPRPANWLCFARLAICEGGFSIHA